MKTTRSLTGITAIIALTIFSAVLLLAGCGGGTGGSVTSVDGTPTAADFVIGNLSQLKGADITAVTITAKPGKTSGDITNIRYNGLETLPPPGTGAYPVTFDVAAANGWKAAAGLSAGTLTINDTRIESITALSTYLSGQSNNTKANPYYIALNINAGDFAALKTTLNSAQNKYVYLDLSGSNITTIPEDAFNTGRPSWTGCATLAGITIPNGVTAIGAGAFYDCANLASVTIPDSVTAIGAGAFNRCVSLTSITIPNSVTSVGTTAFRDCTSLTSVTIGNSVITIGDSAFMSCSSLTSVTIPNSVTSIGTLAFYDCASLESIIIPDSVTAIGAGAFNRCASLESITIPDSVTSIMSSAFYLCTSLESVTIGNNVTSIGTLAFYDCANLASVTFENTIASDKFNNYSVFQGDLRDKFYATDANLGTPGTYTTTAPVSWGAVWTKQP